MVLAGGLGCLLFGRRAGDNSTQALPSSSEHHLENPARTKTMRPAARSSTATARRHGIMHHAPRPGQAPLLRVIMPRGQVKHRDCGGFGYPGVSSDFVRVHVQAIKPPLRFGLLWRRRGGGTGGAFASVRRLRLVFPSGFSRCLFSAAVPPPRSIRHVGQASRYS